MIISRQISKRAIAVGVCEPHVLVLLPVLAMAKLTAPTALWVLTFASLSVAHAMRKMMMMTRRD